MNAVTIAFHSTAQTEAASLSRRLSQLGYAVREEPCDGVAGGLGASLLSARGPILMLINDGLLHARACQTGLLDAWRELHQRPDVHALMASSQRSGPGEVSARVLTSLSRVSDVIRYMNYWQAAYLTKRRQVGASHDATAVAELTDVRRISQEIGELLRLIRENTPTDVRTLESGDASAIARLVGGPPAPALSPPSLAPEPQSTQDSEEDAPNAESAEESTPNAVQLDPVARTSTPFALAAAVAQQELAEHNPAASTVSLTPTVTETADHESYPDTSSTSVATSHSQDGATSVTQAGESIDSTSVASVADRDLTASEPALAIAQPLDAPAADTESLTALDPQIGSQVKQSRETELTVRSDEDDQDPQRAGSALPDKPATLPTTELLPDPELEAARLTESRGRNLEIYLNYLQAGGHTEARNFAEEVLARDPGDVRLKYALGVQLLSDGEDEEEELREHGTQLLTELLSTDCRAAAHLCLGELAQRERDFGSARRHLLAAYRANRRLDTELSYRIGALIMDEFDEDKRAARRFLRRSLRSSVDNLADAHYRLGYLELRSQRLRRATTYLKEAVRLDPHHPFAAYELAVALLQRGRDARAAVYFQQAAEVNPELDTESNRDAFEPPTSLSASSQLREGLAGKFERFVQAREDDREDPHADLESAPVEETVSAAPAPAPEPASVPQKSPRVLTILITGASSGIGAATARAFAADGHRLILTGRRVDRLLDLAAELKRDYATGVRLLGFDVTDRQLAERLLASLKEEFAEVDVLVNNAGKAKGLAPIHEGDFAHWDEMIDVNIRGLLHMTRLVSPGMVARGSGHIINVCSTAGHEVYPNGAVYCATKHAVDAITRGTRLDLFKYGIRVSQISPAAVEETEFSAVRFDGDQERAAAVYADFQPLRANDVANAIKWLVDQPAHVNVQDLVVLSTQQANSTTIDRSGRISATNPD